jgi:hypothetical protein
MSGKNEWVCKNWLNEPKDIFILEFLPDYKAFLHTMYVKIIWLQIGGRCKWSLQRRRVGEVAYSSKRAAIPADSMTKINFYFHKRTYSISIHGGFFITG